MALRDQPYIPLYVQDFLTDEKLIECSSSATGVYIRLICVMHKSDPYGTILLKQKDKQKQSTVENFAYKLVKSMPYDYSIILSALKELTDEGVLIIEGDKLIQKRMIRDCELSEIRAIAGKKGGKNTQKFAKAKSKANTEDEDENENINEDINKNVSINNIEERQKIFKKEVESFSNKYSLNMLTAFYAYWSEPNQSGKKMRKEMQQTWETGRRLITWNNRDKK